MKSEHNAQELITLLLQSSGIPLEHGEQAHAEAAALLKDTGLDDPHLVDLEHLPFVTVDNAGSRDLDQALYVAAVNGGFRIHYALADAAWYVRPGGALWRDALTRGASLYAPDRALPMLPVSLSEGLVSLNPGVTRRSLIFDMSVSAEGDITRSKVFRARVRSRLQLTYAGVQRVVDGEVELDEARAPNPASLAIESSDDAAIIDSLHSLKAAGVALELAQQRRGVMPFDRTESEINVSGDPPAFDIEPRERLGSERWNEQLSLACNMQGAALLVALEKDDTELEPVFRVHDAPGSGRLRDLEDTLKALNGRLSLGGAWRRDRKLEPSLASWFGALPPKAAPRLKRAIQRQILRTQNASHYEAAAGRHHALAAESYARFSSPMREIVGIHTHLVALDALGLQASDAARSSDIRDAVIQSAEDSRARQKSLDRAILFEVIADLFEKDLASDDTPWRSGTLLGIDKLKLHVGLDGMALDIKLYRDDLDALSGVTWEFDTVSATPLTDGDDATGHSLGFVLGDGVRIRAERYDIERRRFVFAIKPLGNRPDLKDKSRRAIRERKTPSNEAPRRERRARRG